MSKRVEFEVKFTNEDKEKDFSIIKKYNGRKIKLETIEELLSFMREVNNSLIIYKNGDIEVYNDWRE